MKEEAAAASIARLRFALVTAYRVSLAIAWVSLVYLLFIFGHTETAPLGRVLTVCAIAACAAIVAGILQWVGLPALPPNASPQKGRQPRQRA